MEAEKVKLCVEVRIKPGVMPSAQETEQAVARLLKKRTIWYKDGPIAVTAGEDDFVDKHFESVRICDTDPEQAKTSDVLLFWQVLLQVYPYQLNFEEPAEEVDDEDDIPSFTEYIMPSTYFEGQWEALHFESDLKVRLLNYTRSALLFSDFSVDPNIISWNRLVLLHGPPGTGKTTLCKALAHKLSIKLSSRFKETQLIEINAHSLFSKWFSESGKLVSKLFTKIREMAEVDDSMVFVLIDEVESLTAARKAAVQGSEPSDALRAVNAMLTHLDLLKGYRNVMVLCTSNISEAIDDAFLDRADLKIYVGNPGFEARCEILTSCINELHRTGLISDTGINSTHRRKETGEFISHNDMNSTESDKYQSMLFSICTKCEGKSGRQLRKLPFLAFANHIKDCTCTLNTFLNAMAMYTNPIEEPFGSQDDTKAMQL